MKVDVDQSVLNDAIGIVALARSSRTTMPVLSHFLLKAENGQMSISATDRDLAITVSINANVREAGSILLPGEIFSQFVASVSGSISIQEGKGSKWVIKAGKTTCNLTSMDTMEFPILKEWDDSVSIITQVPGSEILQISRQVLLAASKDVNRPALTGISTEVQGGKMKLVATDGYRLALRSDDVAGQDMLSVILPAPALKAISKAAAVFKKSPTTVSLGKFNDNGADMIFMIETGEEHGIRRIVLSSMLIDGAYPDYRGVIPKESAETVIADRADLLDSVRTALLMAKDNNNTIALKVSGDLGSLMISSTSIEMGDIVVAVPVNASGHIQVSVSGVFLRDSLDAMLSPKIVIGWSSPTRPITIVEHGDDDSLLHVIMPRHSR